MNEENKHGSGVSLLKCCGGPQFDSCGRRWTEEHPDNVTWCPSDSTCPWCGGEGGSVEIEGTRKDGFSENVWAKAGTLIAWDEKP